MAGPISEFPLYVKNVVWATKSTRRKTVLCVSRSPLDGSSNFKFVSIGWVFLGGCHYGFLLLWLLFYLCYFCLRIAQGISMIKLEDP